MCFNLFNNGCGCNNVPRCCCSQNPTRVIVGPAGPTGPTGPAGASSVISSLAYLNAPTATTTPVTFTTFEVFPTTSTSIVPSASGVTLTPGTYLIDFGVIANAAGASSGTPAAYLTAGGTAEVANSRVTGSADDTTNLTNRVIVSPMANTTYQLQIDTTDAAITYSTPFLTVSKLA